MAAKNDRIFCLCFILYRQLSRSLYKRLFHKIYCLDGGFALQQHVQGATALGGCRKVRFRAKNKTETYIS